MRRSLEDNFLVAHPNGEVQKSGSGGAGNGPKAVSRPCINPTFELFQTDFGTTSSELNTSILKLYRTLSNSYSHFVCSFVYNLLIVLDFAIPNYPELLDLLLVSFPLAPLSRSQIPSLAYTGPELSSPFRNPPVSHHRCSSFNPMMIDS